MNVLFTGDYLPDYNRTRIIRAGLRKLGATVVDMPFRGSLGRARRGIARAAGGCDFIFMPSFTHREVPVVRRICGGRPVIFDPLVSRYLTKVFDYRLVSRYSLSALRNYLRDKRAMEAADFVVTDTLAHQRYFHDTFRIPNEKMGTLYIGNDFDEFFPSEPAGRRAAETPLRVGFYGGFIPLQGVMNILEAADLLKDRKDLLFELIGTGFEHERARAWLAKRDPGNVELAGWVGAGELPARVNRFDIALGIFGTTAKSDLVIPNKIYHYAACARPVITKDSPAVRELFRDGTDVILVEPSPGKIAEAVSALAGDEPRRLALGRSAYHRLKTTWDEVRVAERLLEYHRLLAGSGAAVSPTGSAALSP